MVSFGIRLKDSYGGGTIIVIMGISLERVSGIKNSRNPNPKGRYQPLPLHPYASLQPPFTSFFISDLAPPSRLCCQQSVYRRREDQCINVVLIGRSGSVWIVEVVTAAVVTSVGDGGAVHLRRTYFTPLFLLPQFVEIP